MFPKLHESVKTKTYYELDSGKHFSLNCTADHAEEFKWQQETYKGTKVVSNSSTLHINSVSYRDQGSYYCIVKGKKDYDTSAAQVLVMKDYLQFLVEVLTNNSLTNNVSTEIVNTLRNEHLNVTQPEIGGEGEIFKLYVFKKILKKTQPSKVYELIKDKLDSLRDKLRTWDYEIIRTGKICRFLDLSYIHYFDVCMLQQ
ncbi:hypothetical protein HOLleu_20385 [Holothuria leucospilota]|uniref:Ig-like domain-containing protein n=1 Tax=Holothuria leucospilota TaxID=206669 RepID=A0A9Q1H8P3_HOLLE|nr:hypothetical protein HOLleu_20385 [Holothuria leucospilota]